MKINSQILKTSLLKLPKEELIKLIQQLDSQKNHFEKRNTELENAVDSYLEAESKFQTLFEMSDDAILVIEKEKFVDCNKAVVKMLGYENKEQFLNTHPSELSPLRQPDGQLSFRKAQEMMRLARKNESHHFEWIHTKLNGEDFPVEVWLSATKFKGKYIINTIWRDLTEIKKTEQALNKSFKEKEVLLKEIHHRVKNNLQVIISLLRLQMNEIDSEEIQYHFSEVINRVMVISQIHQKLYHEKTLSSINLKSYLTDLWNEIKKINASDKIINIKIDSEINVIGLQTIVPLGLLVNELISNSLKHAFLKIKSGNIELSFKKTDTKHFIFTYSDNGNWIESAKLKKGFGTELIEILIQQLEGTMEKIIDKKGTKYTFKVKNLDVK